MLSKLFSWFKKSEQKDIEQIDTEEESFLCYKINQDGDVYVDVNIKDSTPKSVSEFAKLITDLASYKFYFDTMQVIMEGFQESENPEVVDLFLSEIVKHSKDNLENLKESAKDVPTDEPFIKPSDVI